MVGNILLYQALNIERKNHKKFPNYVYALIFIAVISTFVQLMIQFRKTNVKAIKFLTYPLTIFEFCICFREEKLDGIEEANERQYTPVWRNILCCGCVCMLFWLWYSIIIYPFITLVVILSLCKYSDNDIELSKLYVLYRNHNIIAFFIEDLPILAALIQIYVINNNRLLVLIWVCVSAGFKFIMILIRYITEKKLLFTIEEVHPMTQSRIELQPV